MLLKFLELVPHLKDVYVFHPSPLILNKGKQQIETLNMMKWKPV